MMKNNTPENSQNALPYWKKTGSQPKKVSEDYSLENETPEVRTVRGLLEESVGENAYKRWFKKLRFVPKESCCRVGVPSEMHQLWIETNFIPSLTQAIEAGFGKPLVPRFYLIEEEEVKLKNEPKVEPEPKEGATKDSPNKKATRQARLNPLYTFKRFVVGTSNEFAHASCVAVADGAGGGMNPLFLHSESGLGKTHLMQAIGHAVLEQNEKAQIMYLSCEQFINEFIEALQKGGLASFRNRYRHLDLLMVDDVQFLNGKEKSQEEFFHTFNALLDGQAQVILSSDRPAHNIQLLEPRLISRFESGLTVDLKPPGLELRIAILQNKLTEWDMKIPKDVLVYIAERVRSNVRRLEGALVKVATYTSLGQGNLSLDKVEELLRDIFHEETRSKASIDSIQKAVVEYYDLRLTDMSNRRRPQNVAFARQVAMYLSRRLTNSSLMEIGEAFGGRDHGTVMYACRKVEKLLKNDSPIQTEIEEIEYKVTH